VTLKAKKLLGDDRRKLILEWLKDSEEPLTGSKLAEKTNVSRQVIVQDISLLKAKNEPIIATSEGYIYLSKETQSDRKKCVVACKHTSEETLDELVTMVEYGVLVKDVTVEHKLYGELTALLMIGNKLQAEQFVKRIKEENAAYLLELTDGIHLHTLEADSEEQLEAVCNALQDKGYLISSSF
jgi:transcriptional regulator of NAD metabolism